MTEEGRAPVDIPPEGDEARGGAAGFAGRLPGRILSAIGALAVMAMLLNVVVDVVMRYVFNDPISGSLEVITYYWMIAIAFVGAYAAQQRVEHIEVTVLVDRLPARPRLFLSVLADLATLAFLVALIWYGWQQALDSLDEGEVAGATQVVVWPSRFLVPLGLGAFAIQLFIDMLRTLLRGTRVEHELPPEEAIL